MQWIRVDPDPKRWLLLYSFVSFEIFQHFWNFCCLLLWKCKNKLFCNMQGWGWEQSILHREDGQSLASTDSRRLDWRVQGMNKIWRNGLRIRQVIKSSTISNCVANCAIPIHWHLKGNVNDWVSEYRREDFLLRSYACTHIRKYIPIYLLKIDSVFLWGVHQ